MGSGPGGSCGAFKFLLTEEDEPYYEFLSSGRMCFLGADPSRGKSRSLSSQLAPCSLEADCPDRKTKLPLLCAVLHTLHD